MTSPRNQSGIITFSIIGAIIIVVAAWLTKGSENTDVWLYVFSMWMILFSAFEVRTPGNPSKASKLVLSILVGAAALIAGAWWANGAEHAWLFLTSTSTLLVSFFILAPRNE